MNIITNDAQNAGEGENGGAGRRHEKRAKEFEIGKGVRYAMPFRSVIGVMEAVPYQEGGEEKGGENVERCEEICPLRSCEAV